MSGAGEVLVPGKLWSLLEMLEIKAKAFMRATRTLASLETILTQMTEDQRRDKIGHDNIERYCKTLRDFREGCSALGARVTEAAAAEFIKSLERGAMIGSEIAEETRQLRKNLNRELDLAKVFAMPPDEVKYYGGAVEMFGLEVTSKFPSTIPEIDEAGKCLAMGRHAAAIFHLMRVVEIALRGLGKALAMPDPKPDWGEVIRAIDTALKVPKNQRTLTIDHDFLAGASAHMHAIKLAWRNQVMHVDTTFSLENTHNIFNATKGLLQHLSTTISE